MSAATRAPRVVVGVSDSLTGLRALRQGVAAARERGLELHVVRVYAAPGPDVAYAGPGGAPGCPVRAPDDTSPLTYSPRLERERAARAIVQQAFAMALGGFPPDVAVHIHVRQGSPQRILVNVAYDERDLLIVGTTRRSRFWPSRQSICRHVTEHASCPVLVVPPSSAILELEGRSWLRRRALPRELSELTGRTTSR